MGALIGASVGLVAALPLVFALHRMQGVAAGIVAVLVSLIILHAGMFVVYRLGPEMLVVCVVCAVASFLAVVCVSALMRAR